MTRIHRILLAGLTAGGMTWCATAQSPAAKVGAVRASSESESEPVTRAAPPDSEKYFEDNRPAGSAGSSGVVQAGGTSNGSFLGKAWNNIKSLGSGDAKSVDQGLMPLSPATMPQFNQGGRGTVPPVNQPARAGAGPQTQTGFRPQPQSQQTSRFGGQPVMAGPNGTGAAPQNIAGKPAFNWYGYGSSVPGANPLAPQGQYPQVSPNWMVQTGATPGAIPLTGVPPTAAVAGPMTTPTIPTTAMPSATGPVNLPNPAITFSPPPPSATVPTTPVATTPTYTTIPTITPPPITPAPNPVLFPSFPPPPPAPKSDEPTWSPAARRPSIEQTSGKNTGSVVHAVALEPEEPLWQTAKTPVPKLLPVPEQQPVAIAPKPTLPDLSGGGLPAAIPEVAMPVAIQTPVKQTPNFAPLPTAPVVHHQPMTWQTPVAEQPKPQPVATQPVMMRTPNPYPAVVNPQPKSVASVATMSQQPQPRPQARPTPVPVRPTNGELSAPPIDVPPPREIVLSASKQILQLEALMSQAAVKHATVLDVNQTAPQRLKVLLACKTETAARAAAAEIAKVEALKPYTVDFEVRLSGQ